MTISVKGVIAGLATGAFLLPAAVAQADNCSALKAQTDTLVQSYANTAIGLNAKLVAYNEKSAALTEVYESQMDVISVFEAISTGDTEGSASEIIGAEESRLDDAAMREAAEQLKASIADINIVLDTLAVQKPAMEAALGILESQCPNLGEEEVPDAAPAIASAGPGAGNPVPEKIPTVFLNYWKHDASNRVYKGEDASLLRNGNVAVKVDCDGFGTVRDQPGKLCVGEWYDQSGNRAGDYRAVYVINSSTKLPMLMGELTTQANPTAWTPWDFYEMTQAQAEQEGLIEIAP